MAYIIEGMRYPEEIIEEVRSRNDIVDVVSQYVKLQKKGASHFGNCPFHNEKTPSFSVSGAKQMFYCFGCGVGGNVFTFLMKYDNLSFQEAVKVLADRAGVKLPEEEDSLEARDQRDRRDALLAMNKDAATFYYKALRDAAGEKGRAYFKERGLSDEIMHRFGLGYADVKGDALVRAMREKGYEDALLIEGGIAKYDEKHGTRARFWNRVMFPIQDLNGRVIGFGGRVMGQGEPKYLNSPDTPLFDKSRNLYGLNYAKGARKGYFILCEGYLDVIAVHELYAPVAVASLGTAFTAGQAALLKRYVREVYLAYDWDDAGIRAAIRAIGILKDAGVNCKVMRLSPHKDPDEFLRTEGEKAFEERIRKALNPFFFEVEVLERAYQMNDPAQKTAFYKEVAALLCRFDTAIERDAYLVSFAEQYQVAADDMRALVTQHAAAQTMGKPLRVRTTPLEREKQKADIRVKPQRMLLTWLAEEPNVFETVAHYVTPDDFTDPVCREVAKRLFSALSENKGKGVVAAGLLQDITEEEMLEQAAAILNAPLPDLGTDKERGKALRDVVYDIKRDRMEARQREAQGPDTLAKTIEDKKLLEELKRAPQLVIA